MDTKLFLFSLLFLISNAIGSVAGFGSAVICLTLGAHLYPIEVMVPVIVPVNLLSSTYIAFRYSHATDWKIFVGKILPFTALGLLAGMFVSPHIHGRALKIIFGVFVLYFAIWELAQELMRTLRGRRVEDAIESQHKKLPRWKSALFLLSGGALQGIYASGGPMVVSYAAKTIHDKEVFRSTLSTLWTVLNTAMLVSFLQSGRIDGATFATSAWLAPALVLGLWIGDVAHKRVSQHAFRTFVFLMLTVSGLALLWS